MAYLLAAVAGVLLAIGGTMVVQYVIGRRRDRQRALDAAAARARKAESDGAAKLEAEVAHSKRRMEKALERFEEDVGQRGDSSSLVEFLRERVRERRTQKEPAGSTNPGDETDDA